MTTEEYAAHKKRQRMRAWRDKQPEEWHEKRRANANAYYHEHKGNPEYAAKRKESRRKYVRKSLEEHREEKYKAVADWRKRHPDKCREYTENFRRSLGEEAWKERQRQYNRSCAERGIQRANLWPEAFRSDAKEWRRRMGLSQKELSAMCGKNGAWFVSKVECGKEAPNEELLNLMHIVWRPDCGWPYKTKYGAGLLNASICNCCERIDCDWSRLKVPVEGWKARAVALNVRQKTVMNWHVESCPMYREPNRPFY